VLLLAAALYYDYVYHTICEPRGEAVASNAKHSKPSNCLFLLRDSKGIRRQCESMSHSLLLGSVSGVLQFPLSGLLQILNLQNNEAITLVHRNNNRTMTSAPPSQMTSARQLKLSPVQCKSLFTALWRNLETNSDPSSANINTNGDGHQQRTKLGDNLISLVCS